MNFHSSLTNHHSHHHCRLMGPVSRKLFGPEKPFVQFRAAYSVKLAFLYVVKGIKIKITAKFRTSRHLRFEDTKRIVSHEIRPKSFGTFEKRAYGLAITIIAIANVPVTINCPHNRIWIINTELSLIVFKYTTNEMLLL